MQLPKQQHAIPIGEQRDRDPFMGAGRRAFVRYPLALDATVVDAMGREIACEMKDFCMGGMLLHYRKQPQSSPALALDVNDRIIVRCVVPLSGKASRMEFHARVARTTQDGLGVAFVTPDQGALQAMQQYAVQSAASGAAPLRQIGAGQLGHRCGDMVSGCNHLVQATMESLLAQLEQRLARHLFELSREAAKPEIQNDFFKASEAIAAKWQGFLQVARAHFNECLQSAHNKALMVKDQESTPIEALSLDEVSLIDDDDLGAWLAISDVTNKAEERYKEILALLEERLSVMFNARITHANDPYGPALFVESFQAGLGQYKFKEATNGACYALFKEILIGLLGDLYGKLNGLLIGYGILPDLKFATIHRPVLPNRRSEGVGSGAPPEAAEPAPRPVQQDAVSPALNAAVAAPAPAPAAPDLLQLVQDLRALRSDLTQQRRGPPAAAAAAVGIADSAMAPRSEVVYTTSDLLSAISELQANAAEHALEGQAMHLKSRILAALAEKGGEATGAALDTRDNNVLEITGDLFGAMQGDPLVADSVKPWLKRLELPVFKTALLDSTLFLDHGHVVRQVVNNIAQLEEYRKGKAKSEQNAISTAVEALLERIAAESGEGTEIFEQILEKLTKLIKIQDQAYADNISELAKACEEAPPVAEDLPREGGEDAVGNADLHKWLLYARRLRLGDNLLQIQTGRPPRRLRVGWMDREKSLYVLVNLRGITESVLRAEDLAALMSRGILEPQGNAAEPAMDRAQYVIMQDLYRQVLHESTHDGVTGLINRREFERVVKEAVAGAKQDGLRHVLIFADIDKFSAINTRCGYAGGDQLLQAVVGILQGGLPGGASLARLGADQFGILLEKCALDEALAVAENEIEGVAQYQMEWKGESYSVTLSMGLVPISARDSDVDDLLHASEASCNIAKDTGGNRLQVYHAGHARIAHQTELMKWVGKIDKMLAEDALEIRCQRIQPLANDGAEPPHFEILVGVRDEQGAVVSPVEFIRAAEWYRRMGAVDRYVVGKTLSWLDHHPEVVARIGGVSINLSGQSLNEEDFFDFILGQLEAVSVPRDKLCFEVTETVGVDNLSDAALFIERVRDLGCRFSLDDFGSGMSSYGYLKQLPVDVVKIDGVFVQHLVADSSDYAVVKSVTEIAHFMNKKVVAEFVENAEALELLRGIGVDYVQGFMIDRPAPIESLRNLATAADPA